jgi:hypothetical protein
MGCLNDNTRAELLQLVLARDDDAFWQLLKGFRRKKSKASHNSWRGAARSSLALQATPLQSLENRAEIIARPESVSNT